MDEFLDYLKEECLAGVWSRGVALSRNSKSVERVSSATEQSELKFKIQTTERLLAFQVTLWPKDQDAHCNCGSKIEPCHHVVAVALAVQNGLVSITHDAPKSEGARLEYAWIFDESDRQKKPKITLKRTLMVNGEATPLNGSLTSYIGGIQSGRISSPLPSVTPTDLKIDELYLKGSPLASDLLRVVQELQSLPILGHPTLTSLKVDPNKRNPKLTITDHGSGSILVTPELHESGTEIEGGLFLKDDKLCLRSGGEHYQTRVLHPELFENFLKEELPKLREIFEIEIKTARLPKIVDVDPILSLSIHSLDPETLSVTATLQYPTLRRNEILNRNLKREGELIKEARTLYELSIDQPVKMSVKEALRLRERPLQSQNLDEIDLFLGDFFKISAGISLEAALKEKETLLKLLTLREKKSKPDLRVNELLRSLSRGNSLAVTHGNENIDPKLWDILRDYQKRGVEWLGEKARTLQGAILADDMGLGKTVQTLAALKGPSLVIVPTSLLKNWKSEAARFRPDLSVQIYHGPHRSWIDSDLTVTTYALLRLEPDQFISRNWNTVILDEAHLIRNPETQAAVATTKLSAEFRIALTGTPIQNRKRDLFSLFQFVAPDFFVSEGELDPQLTSPFFLRRTKAEVLTELPPKTYVEHWIEFDEKEKSLYDSMFSAAKKEILERIGDSESLSPFTLFEVLLRSRQVCNHSGLVDPARLPEASSKLTAILELARELMESGHSILIYSQWTQFLNILENHFKKTAPYFRLDGSTQNRGEVVEKFQQSEYPTVFLLSLHAGGVGLNLVKASHVIFCDPWWNPYVELQAEDRAYRMGQEKPVTIHRMLVSDSIEVQIRELQQQKMKLGEEVFQSQDLATILRSASP